MHRFLSNLLPEGNLLDELLAYFRLSKKNIFGLIRVLGLDIAGIKMYPDFEQEMAMALGDSFDATDIRAYQLADFADSCHLSRLLVSRRLHFIITKLKNALPQIEKFNLKTEAERSYLVQYRQMIEFRCEVLLEQANYIMDIEL